MKFSIATKIGLSLGILVIMLLLASFAGYRATNQLSSSLDYVTGPAWDTADGAMEGSIGIQAQVIATQDMINAAKSGIQLDISQRIEDSRSVENEAFNRMFNAKQLPNDAQQILDNNKKLFYQKKIQTIEFSKNYVEASNQLKQAASDFIEFMSVVEDIGDAAVEDLENNPNRSYNWRQLQPRWEAADGAMEARIALLERMHYYQRIVDDISSLKDSRQQLTRSLGELEEKIQQLASLDAFDSSIPSGPYKGMHYIETLQQKLSEHESLMSSAIDSFIKFSTVTKDYLDFSQTLLDELEELETIADSKVEGEKSNIESTVSAAYSFITLASVLGLIVCVIAIFFTLNLIAKPLSLVAENLRDISQGEGNLNVSLEVKSNDEIGEIATGFNEFVKKIKQTISKVTESTEQLNTATEQMSMATTQSNQNVSEQKSEIGQVATAMNQMAATVADVNSNASQAATATTEAQRQAGNVQKIVSETIEVIRNLADEVGNAVTVINSVEQDSHEIGSVLDVIRGIADQTNLLALNAAIEAARAGEQGRGFAVVADEVRTLASRTQESTQSIQIMIERLQENTNQAVNVMGVGQKQAENGVEHVNKAGAALQEINQSVKVISDMNCQIATAAQQQNAVADEINRNISNINLLAEKNVDTSEQIKTSGSNLENLSSELSHLVSEFKT